MKFFYLVSILTFFSLVAGVTNTNDEDGARENKKALKSDHKLDHDITFNKSSSEDRMKDNSRFQSTPKSNVSTKISTTEDDSDKNDSNSVSNSNSNSEHINTTEADGENKKDNKENLKSNPISEHESKSKPIPKFQPNQITGILAMLKTNHTNYQFQRVNQCFYLKHPQIIKSIFIPTDNLKLNAYSTCNCQGKAITSGYTGFHKFDDGKPVISLSLEFLVKGCKVL